MSSAHPVAKTAVVATAVTPGPVAGREDRGRGRGRHTGRGVAGESSAGWSRSEWDGQVSNLRPWD